LAVDLGGTKTALARVNAEGHVSEREQVRASLSLKETSALISARAEGVDGVGVIVPGIYDSGTGQAWAPNLWGWDEVPIRTELETLKVPVAIECDRAGYVLGEQWLGAAQGLRDVVFVAVGTGIGVGILSGGRIISGARGIAGAAGWFALDPRWKDEYARTGCWETEAAGPAVGRKAGRSTKAVVEAARAGDAAALAVIDDVSEYLAMGVANLISLLDPEMVVLGGGLMNAGDLLLDRICTRAARWAQPIAFPKTRIELTRLGDDAGLLGAARLALRNLEAQ
jgi:glucokinase